MKSRTTRSVKVFVLIGLSLFLVSCGASKVAKNSGSSTDLSSRANDSIAPSNFQGLVSDCNGIQTSEMRMAVASYVDSYSGEAIPEYVQMRILDLPDSFYSSSGNCFFIVSRIKNKTCQESLIKPQKAPRKV